MTSFCQWQMDYIFFLYGLSFLILASICLILKRSKSQVLPWRWLCLFAVLHGLSQWFQLFAQSFAYNVIFDYIQIVLMAISFIFLLEFARAGMLAAWGRGVGRWVFIPLILLTIWQGFGGPTNLSVFSSYFLGLVGGLWAAFTLLGASRTKDASGRYLALAALFMAFYAFAAGIVVPKFSFFTAPVLNYDSFMRITGFPIQALRAVTITAIAVALWMHFQLLHKTDYAWFHKIGIYRFMSRMALLLPIIIICGWIATEMAGRYEEKTIRQSLLIRAKTLAHILNPESIKKLTGGNADIGALDYESLKRQLTRVYDSDPNVRYVYLLGWRDNKVIFLVDTTPEINKTIPQIPLEAAPGEIYRDAPEGLKISFLKGQDITDGPYTDKWGSFVSGFAVIRDAVSKQVLAVLAIDLEAKDLFRRVTITRLTPIIITMLIFILLLGFFIAQPRLLELSSQMSESENRYRLLAENASDMIWTVDTKLKFTYINPAISRFLGYSTEETLYLTIDKILTPASLEVIKEIFQKRTYIEHLRQKDFFRMNTLELEHFHKDGSTIWSDVKLDFLHDKYGNIIGAMGVTRDISERKRAEEVIRESEERYRTLIDTSPDGIELLSLEGKFLLVNKQALKMGGWDSAGELIGRNLLDFVAREDWPRAIEGMRTIMFSGAIKSLELSMLKKDGSYFSVELNASLLRDSNGQPSACLAVVRDITERKKVEGELKNAYEQLKSTQAQLMQAEKMQTIGRLASGVAHEVRNPLGIILQGVNYLEKDIGPEKSQQSEVLNMMKDAAYRSNKIIRSLLDFARSSPLEFRLCEIEKILQEAINLVLKESTLADVTITTDFNCKFSLVNAESTQLEQAFVNIILNAIQATTKEGVVNIRLYNKEAKELKEGVGRRSSDLFKLDDLTIICEIEDKGTGIPVDIINRVFDPFFTTKSPGGGVGLGLSITRTIIDNHRGLIKIDSKEGQGTTVSVILPIAKGWQEKEKTG